MDVNLSNTSTTFNCERLLKPNEVSKKLNISRSFTYKILQSGLLPSVRLGKTYRVRPQDLFEYIQRHLHGYQDEC